MAMRFIQVCVAGTQSDETALGAALDLGRQFNAHVEALHGKADPRESLIVIGPGVGGTMVQDMLRAAEEEVAARVDAVQRVFDSATADLGDIGEGRRGFGASLAIVEGRHAAMVAQRGRLADLVVAARQADSNDVDEILTLESVLFESGRPVLVVPPGHVRHEFGAVAIAWDGSLEASRAVHGAMPFLEAAERVVIFTVEEAGKAPASSEALASALARHGVEATAKAIEGDGAISVALLGAAADEGCGMLVMGGYGHSRLRELVLGGVTRDVLAASALPVLLAH